MGEAGIYFTFDVSSAGVVYMDLVIFKGTRFFETGHLDTKVYQKSINAYSYIPASSDHPVAAKRGFIKAELLRYVRISCLYVYFQEIRKLFYSRLRARGYSRSFLLPIFHAVKFSSRSELLQPRPKATAKSVPLVLVTEYSRHTRDINLPQILRKFWHLVTQSDDKDAFKDCTPMVAFKRGKNLRGIISGLQKRARANLHL